MAGFAPKTCEQSILISMLCISKLYSNLLYFNDRTTDLHPHSLNELNLLPSHSNLGHWMFIIGSIQRFLICTFAWLYSFSRLSKLHKIGDVFLPKCIFRYHVWREPWPCRECFVRSHGKYRRRCIH